MDLLQPSYNARHEASTIYCRSRRFVACTHRRGSIDRARRSPGDRENKNGSRTPVSIDGSGPEHHDRLRAPAHQFTEPARGWRLRIEETYFMEARRRSYRTLELRQ